MTVESLARESCVPTVPAEISEVEAANYRLEIITDPDDPLLVEVANINADHGPIPGLTVHDYQQIVRRKGGVLMGHMGEGGWLVSEAAITLKPDDTLNPSVLERNLPSWLGYNYGSAVAPGYGGKRLQQEAYVARQVVAQQAGKEAVSGSVRITNLKSVRSLFRTGSLMLADAPGYFGELPHQDRVLCIRDLEIGNPLSDQGLALVGNAAGAGQGCDKLCDVEGLVRSRREVIALPITQSATVDPRTKSASRFLLISGYTGVSCHTVPSDFGQPEGLNAMAFVRDETLPDDMRAMVRDRKDALASILALNT